MILQSITTRDIPSTNYRPARVRAQSSGGVSIIVPRNDDEHADAHARAARALADLLGWTDKLIPGATCDGYVYIIDGGDRI